MSQPEKLSRGLKTFSNNYLEGPEVNDTAVLMERTCQADGKDI